jgi:hypothetical protein
MFQMIQQLEQILVTGGTWVVLCFLLVAQSYFSSDNRR